MAQNWTNKERTGMWSMGVTSYEDTKVLSVCVIS